MSYAQPQDMICEYGQREMQIIGDPDGTGSMDAVHVQNALDRASSEIDFAVAQRNALPLANPAPQVQQFLTQLCMDIARYRLTGSSGITATEEVRDRYKEAVEKLAQVTSGKILLTVQADEPQGMQPTNLTAGEASSVSAPRHLTPHKLRDFRFGLENFDRIEGYGRDW